MYLPKVTCPLCKSNRIKFLKKINQIKIYECLYCKIAIIPKNSQFQSNIYDFHEYNKLRSRYEKNFIKIIKEIKKIKKSGDVLDVGCGFGLFSNLMLKNGFKVWAIEPTLKTHYLKHSVYKTSFQAFFKKNRRKYDIVVLTDVIEHFENPKYILKNIKSILKNNGIVVIQTPNYKSIMAKTCTYWAWWMTEDHKLIFSTKSLNKTIKESGLTVLINKSYESIVDFKKNFDGNFSNIKNCFFRKFLKFITYIPFFTFYLIFRKILWYFGYGGLILNISKRQ